MFFKKKKNKNELLLDLTADNFSAKKAREISALSNEELSNSFEKARNLVKEESLKGLTKCKICECGNKISKKFPITFTEEELEWAGYYLKYFLDNGFLIKGIVYEYTDDEGKEIVRHDLNVNPWISQENSINFRGYIDSLKSAMVVPHIKNDKYKWQMLSVKKEQIEYRVEFFAVW